MTASIGVSPGSPAAGGRLSIGEATARSALIAMFVVLALDMGGQAGFRNLLVPLCLAVIVAIKGVRFAETSLLWVGLFVVYPGIALVIGIESGADIRVALSQYQGTVLSLALYLAIRRFDYRFAVDAAFFSIASVAAVAVALFLLMYAGVGYFDAMLQRWHESAAGYFGMRLLGGDLFPNVYFKSTLFFVPAFLYLLYRRHWMAASLCFLGLVAGISKTGIVICLMILAVYAFSSFGIGRRIAVLLFIALGALLVSFTPIAGVMVDLVLSGGETIDVRVGHVTSLVRLFSEQPLALLLGFGLGSEFYSSGVSEYVTNIEVDHLNTIRKYGIVWFLAFLFLVLATVVRAWTCAERNVRLLGWALLIAFLVAGTNPVLISPVFFVLLALALAAIEQREKELHFR